MAILGKYLSDGFTIQRADGVFVPMDPGNRDYAELLKAVTEGKDTIDPYVEMVEVPVEPTILEQKVEKLLLLLDEKQVITKEEMEAQRVNVAEG